MRAGSRVQADPGRASSRHFPEHALADAQHAIEPQWRGLFRSGSGSAGRRPAPARTGLDPDRRYLRAYRVRRTNGCDHRRCGPGPERANLDRKRRLQDLRHDRLSYRLCRWSKAAHRADVAGTVAINIRRIVHRTSGGRRRTHGTTGFRRKLQDGLRGTA